MEIKSKNKTIIIDNQYLGCINYYSTLFQSSNIKIEQFDNWEKASFRNRCVILTTNGLLTLTVPVQKGRNQKTVFKDVQIDYSTAWQKQHWRTILSAYRKAPFFEFYENQVLKIFEKKHNFLFDLDFEIFNWLRHVLKLHAPIALTKSYENYDSVEVQDFRNNWLPNNFQLGNQFIQYQQVFSSKHPFQPNLSILDLLFNEGPNSSNLLKQHNP